MICTSLTDAKHLFLFFINCQLYMSHEAAISSWKQGRGHSFVVGRCFQIKMSFGWCSRMTVAIRLKRLRKYTSLKQDAKGSDQYPISLVSFQCVQNRCEHQGQVRSTALSSTKGEEHRFQWARDFHLTWDSSSRYMFNLPCTSPGAQSVALRSPFKLDEHREVFFSCQLRAYQHSYYCR